jgi:hypothetical protein
MIVAGFEPPNSAPDTKAMLSALDRAASFHGYGGGATGGGKDQKCTDESFEKLSLKWTTLLEGSKSNLNPVFKWHEKVMCANINQNYKIVHHLQMFNKEKS